MEIEACRWVLALLIYEEAQSGWLLTYCNSQVKLLAL